jgi:hypothetical protein
MPSEDYTPTPADAAARWAQLAAAGLTARLGCVMSDAQLLLTSFGFGPEVWLMEGAADATSAEFDADRRRTLGARLVVDEAGRPAPFAAFAALGLKPAVNLPTI